MRLSEFIRQNHESIIAMWREFAGTMRPSSGMSELQLDDHIVEILMFIAADVESPQSTDEQVEKSQGRKAEASGDTAAQTHGALRQQDGFDVVEMISEYRALRASICSLWRETGKNLDAKDIDDLERFNEAIDQSVAESVVRFTQTVERSKDLLLGVLGHDIRSPVSAIEGAADLIPRFGAVNPRQSALLTQIKDSAGRVQHIVSGLLDLARSKSGQTLTINKKACCLSTVARRMVEEARVQHGDREFELNIADGIEGPWDEVRLGQVLTNLLSNALQYGASDTPIEVSLTDQGDAVIMAVRNQGEPIPVNHLDSIFRSFTRIADSNAGPPTSNLGLGLFIAREITAAHGGDITVASSATEGTTFSVHLPKKT